VGKGVGRRHVVSLHLLVSWGCTLDEGANQFRQAFEIACFL
jgi:hypothetical protein